MRVLRASDGVVSTSLCADAYVLELAGPGRIAALSWQVDHPVSAAPDWARSLPKAWNDAERLYALAPGLTVFGAGEGARTRRMLERTGFETFELSWASGFDGVRANLLALGREQVRQQAAGLLQPALLRLLLLLPLLELLTHHVEMPMHSGESAPRAEARSQRRGARHLLNLPLQRRVRVHEYGHVLQRLLF